MAEFWNSVSNRWDSVSVQLAVWGGVLALLIVAAVAVVRRLRDFTKGAEQDAAHLLTNFREMKLQGDISDTEFRTINTLLSVKQPSKVKHTQDTT
jgi:hypothetical protein